MLVSSYLQFLPVKKAADSQFSVYTPTASRVTSYFSPIGYGIVNWFTTADACVHTADTTRLDRINSKHVQFPGFQPKPSAAVLSSLAVQFTLRDESKRDATRRDGLDASRRLERKLHMVMMNLSR